MGKEVDRPKRLWDCLTDRGKENLIKKARELGMFNYSPDDGAKQHAVTVQGKLEGIAEIAKLIALTDSQIKEREDA
jgi:hypothetical protein